MRQICRLVQNYFPPTDAQRLACDGSPRIPSTTQYIAAALRHQRVQRECDHFVSERQSARLQGASDLPAGGGEAVEFLGLGGVFVAGAVPAGGELAPPEFTKSKCDVLALPAVHMCSVQRGIPTHPLQEPRADGTDVRISEVPAKINPAPPSAVPDSSTHVATNNAPKKLRNRISPQTPSTQNNVVDGQP